MSGAASMSAHLLSSAVSIDCDCHRNLTPTFAELPGSGDVFEKLVGDDISDWLLFFPFAVVESKMCGDLDRF